MFIPIKFKPRSDAAKFILKYRRHHNLSRREFANKFGSTREKIRNYETDVTRVPGDLVCMMLASIHPKSPVEVFGHERKTR
jgi:transcriptional regulator with XRE-family HTH domain